MLPDLRVAAWVPGLRASSSAAARSSRSASWDSAESADAGERPRGRVDRGEPGRRDRARGGLASARCSSAPFWASARRPARPPEASRASDDTTGVSWSARRSSPEHGTGPPGLEPGTPGFGDEENHAAIRASGFLGEVFGERAPAVRCKMPRSSSAGAPADATTMILPVMTVVVEASRDWWDYAEIFIAFIAAAATAAAAFAAWKAASASERTGRESRLALGAGAPGQTSAFRLTTWARTRSTEAGPGWPLS